MRKTLNSSARRSAVNLAGQAEAPPTSAPSVSSAHQRVPDRVPMGWLDRLLVATADLPLAKGERAVAEALVECVASILGSYALGATLATGIRGGPLVFRRLPEGSVETQAAADPTRMFPGMRYEYVAPLPGIQVGSTLHVGSDVDDLDADASPAVHLLDRAALVLGLVLPKARTIATLASGAQRSARAFDKRMIQVDKLATFGQLAAGFVHELNNPVTSIVAYSDYLIRKVAEGQGLSDDEDLERLRRINESANRMLRFSREFVGYARPSSGAAVPVKICSVIEQAVAFCEHVLSSAGVGVERRFESEGLAVRARSEHLVQVLVNLLTNACQAAPPTGGRIVLTAVQKDAGARRRAVITIEDNGGGIAPENLPHVFVPFFTTKRGSHGIGLGLAISKSIVENHDGSIHVESTYGRGARFSIELPAIGPGEEHGA
jgi:signal transduction histidine kinase